MTTYENLKYPPGLCRCCLNVGYYKDLDSHYEWCGVNEIYSEMLRQCFGINLKPVNESVKRSTICEFCVLRLRESYAFWKQVLDSEEKIIQKLQNLNEKPSAPDMKVETECQMDIDNIIPMKRDCMTEYDDFVGSNEEIINEGKPVAVKLEIDKIEKTAMKMRKTTLRSVKNHVKDKEVSLMNLSKSMVKTKSKLQMFKDSGIEVFQQKTGKHKMNEYKGRLNACTLLENTTSSPFRWCSRRGFKCFYCGKQEPNTDQLRRHTDLHKLDTLKQLVLKAKNRFIKIDITHLSCRMCSKKFNKLTEATTHLTEKHKKKFAATPLEFAVPYKLNNTNLNCAMCDKSFVNFHTLNTHMNTHFGNCVCETCGAIFVNESRLHCHLSTHDVGLYSCASCDRSFDSPVKLSNHKSVKHSKRNHRCHTCGEVFSSFHSKQTHRIREHEEKHLLHACEFCDKSYARKSHLNTHVRRSHLREKNYVCEVCSDGFFSKMELSHHGLKHSGEKSHQCVICLKSFGRKHSLVEHMRIHNNDRRFVCAYCGQSFIQKCSLKGHLKTHHSVTLE